MSFFQVLEASASSTEKRLEAILSQRHCAKRLDEAIAYSLLGGGKRVRAYLVQEFCELCGSPREHSTDYGCAVEMVHAFSLIHDDLPSMDNDDMRRGKPSNHKAFGEATAILAGDSLALDAFSVICGNEFCVSSQNEQAVIALSRHAGSLGMCAGQQYDIDGEGKKLSIDELTRLVDLKTGALFSCSCLLGCIAAGASELQKQAAIDFGLLTGRAFQITDDLLDIYSTPEVLGKTVGKDALSEKSTFVSLLGENGAKSKAIEYIEKAKNSLDAFFDSNAKNRLTEFCDYILTRKK